MRFLSWLRTCKSPTRGEHSVRRRPTVECLENRLCPSSAALDFSTFLGGSGTDIAYAVAVDGAGNSCGAVQTHFSGSEDAFIAKFNPAGQLVYATYLGGRGTTFGHSIAVDQYGDAYVTGMTNCANFPVKNAFQSQYGGGMGDAFVTKLNPTGSALLYSTYLGGSSVENDNGGTLYGSIAVDQNGNAYVTGITGGPTSNFPSLNGLPTNAGGVFVTRLNTNLAGAASLTYSTIFNASSSTGIAIDNAGDAYITGTANLSFTTTPGAYLTSGASGYVAKFNTNAVGSAALVYATWLSSQGLFPHAIAVDQIGDAYVTGIAQAATLTVTANAFQPTYNSNGLPDDAFVLGLNAAGSGITYASYLGGSGQDWGNAIAIDSAGHIFIAGSTGSRDFPIQNDFQGTLTSGENAFIAEFDPSAATGSSSLIYSSYLGGTSNDTVGYGIAVDGAGDAIMVGQAGPGLPTVNAFQSSFHGAFVTKVTPPA